MATVKPNEGAVWTMEAHTAAKHDLLRDYLAAWFPILASKYAELVFIDGFAGPGRYEKGEPGSPLVAISALIDRKDFWKWTKTRFHFYFNEIDKKRFDALTSELLTAETKRAKGWPANVLIHPSNRNFTDLTKELVAHNQSSPTFAFVDPFGYSDVPIELLAKLVVPKSSELFIYFDYNSVQRFGTSGTVDPRFKDLFGTDDFKLAPSSGSQRKQYFYDLYKSQLQSVCKLPFVQGFEMVNSAGKTTSYLYFCTRHLLGFDKMKAVMWKHAPLGDFRFRDSLAGMQVLVSDHVDTDPLRHALLQKFANSTVSIEKVEQFVVGHTPFVSGHLRQKTLAPMQRDKQLSSPNQPRTGAFPANTLIAFGPPLNTASVSLEGLN